MSAVPPSSGSGADPEGDGGKLPFGGLGSLFNRMKAAALTPPDAARDEFFSAVRKGDIAAVQAALAAGMSPDVRNALGETPLHVAASKNNADMVALLARSGADLRRSTGEDAARTALQYAIDFGADAAAVALIGCGAYDETLFLLHRACEKGKARLVAAMLQAGADATAVNASGTTPLASALIARKYDAVLQLLAAPAVTTSLNVPAPHDALGRTPFHMAVQRGDEGIICRMIALGGFVNQPTAEGLTPLHLAIERGEASLVALLLQSGADAIAPVVDSNGRQLQPSPLLFLCGQRNLSSDVRAAMAAQLLEAGATVDTQDAATGDTALHRVMAAADVSALLRVLLGATQQLEARNKAGRTPLLEAIEGASIHEVADLLAAGADPNGRHDRDARTPLMTAAALGHVDTLRELLKAGANPRLLDAHGNSAIFYARANMRKASDLVPMLEDALKRDAKPLFRGLPPRGGQR